VRIALVLNGAMSTPRVAYDVRAAIARHLRPHAGEFPRDRRRAGRCGPDRGADLRHRDPDHRLPEALGGLLTNVKMDGDILIEGDSILSDNLRLRSIVRTQC
jgi:translocation and assembly module TamB